MLIALDYDGTYTRDPGLWDVFVKTAHERDHVVHLVTMRADCEPVSLTCEVDAIQYTDRRAKREHMAKKGLKVDIWVDDNPEFVGSSAAPRNL